MKDQAETASDAPQQVLADMQANASETAKINLPRTGSLRRTICFQRQKCVAQSVNLIAELLFLFYPFLTIKF